MTYFIFMEAIEKIESLRNHIDELDDRILDLLIRRFAISEKIGGIKAQAGLAIGDSNRESYIIDRLTEKLKGKLKREDIVAIFGPVYNISKKIQIKEK